MGEFHRLSLVLQEFSAEERDPVKITEGWGVMFTCSPPPHYPGKGLHPPAVGGGGDPQPHEPLLDFGGDDSGANLVSILNRIQFSAEKHQSRGIT